MKTKEKPLIIALFGHLPAILLVLLVGLVALFIWEIASYSYLLNDYVKEDERFTKALLKPIFLEILALVLILSGGYFSFKGNKPAKLFVTSFAILITLVNIFFIYEMFQHYRTLSQSSLLMPEIELYLIVVAIFAVGEFLSYYVVSEYQKRASVLIDTTKEIDLNQLWSFIELFGMPQKGNLPFEQDNSLERLKTAQTSMMQPVAEYSPQIGFEFGNDKPKQPRSKAIDYGKMQNLIDKGLGTMDIARVMKCSESAVRKYKQTQNL
jgi:hypothetical protein